MPSLPVTPRPLNHSERAVLEHTLTTDFSRRIHPTKPTGTDRGRRRLGSGSVSVDLRVCEPAQHAALESRLVPVDAHVHDRSGAYTEELLVWLGAGATLAALEYA